MSGLDFEIEIDDRLSGRLGRAAAQAADLTRPMIEIAGELLRSTMRRFATQSGPDGVKWVPRKDQDNPKPLLFASGDLQKQVTSDSGRDFAAVGVEKTGGPALYAGLHQRGGTIRPKTGKALRTPFGVFSSVTIPARPFLGIDDSDRTTVFEILTDFLRGLFTDGGGAVE